MYKTGEFFALDINSLLFLDILREMIGNERERKSKLGVPLIFLGMFQESIFLSFIWHEWLLTSLLLILFGKVNKYVQKPIVSKTKALFGEITRTKCFAFSFILVFTKLQQQWSSNKKSF